MDIRSASASRRSQRESFIFIPLACLTAAAIAVVSFLPPADKSVLHTRGRFHSWGHLLAFTAIGFVTAKTSRSPKIRIIVLLCTIGLGFGIETMENLKFHGGLEWKDIFVDTLGVLCGSLIAVLMTPKTSTR
ncbi:hypothetical protein BH10ACI4_BH10ACI4_07060 [soil metagenome]